MVKRHVMITVDEELHDKAKEKYVNVSGVTESALRDKLGKVDVIINTEIEVCEYCKREMKKAKVILQNGKEVYVDGLTWLYPDERWICPSCLHKEGRRVPACKS